MHKNDNKPDPDGKPVPAGTLPVIFLGYPFALGYVRGAVERAADGLAHVAVASDILRGMPLLEKIERMMAEATLCIFDLTTHNPNVAAEFGIARGRGYSWAILYCTNETLNPKPGRDSSVFSDVKGWDSVLYDDEAGLERELRRLLPEYLAHVAQRRGGNVGAATYHPASITPDRAARRDAPRLYLNVKTNSPGFVGVLAPGSRKPVQKLGSYSLALELQNKGRGAANKVRAVMTGALHVERLGTLTPGEKPVKFTWSLEDQPAYRTAPQFPAVRVEYIDDEGRAYEQVGPLQVRQLSDGTYTYSGGNLEAPRAIEACTIPYGD
jgi:hypothetical protein